MKSSPESQIKRSEDARQDEEDSRVEDLGDMDVMGQQEFH
jgi:hypothetical protein